MIHLSTGPRQRHKITIFLEETTLPYSIKPINIGAGDQFAPESLAISPNNRIPAIVGRSARRWWSAAEHLEPGAILQYLADKTGQFLPKDLRGRVETMQCCSGRWVALDRCSDKIITSAAMRRKKLHMPLNATAKKPSGSMVCSMTVLPIVNHRRRVFDCRYRCFSVDRAAPKTGTRLG